MPTLNGGFFFYAHLYKINYIFLLTVYKITCIL
nr:MAG TPA: hypothetical protein [Caudoviricetes sp.]